MELTIQIPWLTRMRRMAIGLSLVLVLVALALPASAAAPEGIEGDVTVINGADDPVPVTGDVTADVTGSVNVAGTVTVDNEATDPVPVSGDVTADVTGSVAVDGTVAATQSGAWSVGLEGTSQGHLASIDAATSGLTYDENGNLNVHVASGDDTGNGPVLSQQASGCSAGSLILAGSTRRIDIFGPVTSITALMSEGVVITGKRDDAGFVQIVYMARVDATGNTFAQSFPFPLNVDTVTIENLSSSDIANGVFCITSL